MKVFLFRVSIVVSQSQYNWARHKVYFWPFDEKLNKIQYSYNNVANRERGCVIIVYLCARERLLVTIKKELM